MPAASRLHQRSVHVGTAIAEELPCLADLADQVQIQVGGQNFIRANPSLWNEDIGT